MNIPTELAHSNDALFQHLIDGIKDYAIFMVKPSGKIATWNLGVKRLLGYEEHEFIGQEFSLIFSEDDVTQDVPLEELKLAAKDSKAEDERWHKRKDGSLFWANGLVTKMLDEQGNIQGFTKIMRDQTEKKELEKLLLEQTEALKIANKELTNFAGVVSHDLNAPLQTVYGFANILKKHKAVDKDTEESIDMIVEGTHRMINLVNELLDYTTSSAAEDESEIIDSNKVFSDVLSNLSSKIQTSHADITCEELPPVWANEVQLTRVFQNLIENAIKYSVKNSEPTIHISVKSKKDVIFSVEDNGIGITPEQRERLFILFERFNADENILGKGIGLASCKKIIERWGGKIWIESKKGGGSIFSFSIPRPPAVYDSKRDSHGESQGAQHNLVV